MSYPEKFDTTHLTEEELLILREFHERRKLFDDYLTTNKINLHTCPGCGYPTLTARGGYEICSVCDWEDDYQDDKEADEIWGGPNSTLSLTENRLNIGKQIKQITNTTDNQLHELPNDLRLLYGQNNQFRQLLTGNPEVK